MATARQIINIARKYIGLKESPAYSNNIIFNTDYYGHPVSGDRYPWCCTMQWDFFKMGGASNLFYDGKKTASCTTLMNWGKSKGLEVPKEQARMGDWIFFDWDGSGDADHIGIVEDGLKNGKYTTIEGNTSEKNQSDGGMVMRRYRPLDKTVRAIIRPKYEEDDLVYRAYCQTYGWKPWVDDGEVTGTIGESKRMEAMQFDIKSQVTAQCHCQSYGDMNPVAPGNIIGTVAESLRMEAIKLDAPYKIRYKVHIQGIGWSDWFTNGQWAGTKGQGRRLEAIVVEKM